MTWRRPHSKLHRTRHRSPDSSPQSKMVAWFKSTYPILSQGEIEFLGDREIGGFLLPDGTVAQLNHAGEHAIAAERSLASANIRSNNVFFDLSQNGIFRILGDPYQMNIDLGPHITPDQFESIKALIHDRNFYWNLLRGESYRDIEQGETLSKLITAINRTA